MCNGVPLFANNKKALMGIGTNSHSTAAEKLGISEDEYRKYEYHWWDKKIVADYYDQEGERIVSQISKEKSLQLVTALVNKKLGTQVLLAKWLKKTPEEWGRLMKPECKKLAKLVNPKLIIYQDKIAKFKKQKIEKFNPYQAAKLPSLKELKKKLPAQVGDQVWAQVGDQVRAQVGDQVRAQVGDQVWAQVWDQVGDQVWAQVGDQVWAQVRAQVGDQVGAQVWATSYWGVKITLGLPIKHWFFEFLKLGVMIVFVKGKVKVFGRKGMYLGEYDEEDFK